MLLFVLVMLVATAKTLFEKESLVAGKKQGKEAKKADRLTRQAGLQGSQGCLISGLPALFCARN